MNKMIVANLAHRPIRSIISIFAVAIEVTLILLIVGLMLGILDDSKERQKGVGADVIVRPPGSANFAAFSSAPASVKYVDLLLKQPHVLKGSGNTQTRHFMSLYFLQVLAASNDDVATIDRNHARERVDQSRLTRAIWADNTGDLAGFKAN